MEISTQSIKVYDNTVKSSEKFIVDNLSLDLITKWDYTPRVDVQGRGVPGEEVKFKVVMLEGGVPVYHAEIYPGMFATGFRKWVSDYEIQIRDKNDKVLTNWKLLDRIKDGKVCISFDSSSLGDTLAWIPYVEEFRKQYEVKDLIVTTFWNNLFDGEYPSINFKYPGYREPDMDVVIGIGWYDEEDRNTHPIDPRTIPLQKVSADILSTKYSGEIRPLVKKSIFKRPTEKKYVCIATESTAGAKYWHYPNGWQRLIDLIKKMGYEVVLIHRQDNHFKNIIDRSGNLPIEERISDLLQCEFFIGLSSGLSWLSWALGVRTVLISGFTKPFLEFSHKTLRIINENVCNGCFNDPKYKFDRGDWWWCPAHKSTDRYFECTRTIKPEDVFIKILDWLPSNSE